MLLRPAVVVIRRVVVALVLSVFVGVTAIAQTTPAWAVDSWSTPVNVSDYTIASAPQIVAAPNNTLTAIWARYTGPTQVIQTSTSDDAGATWSDAVNVSGGTLSAYSPQIVAAPNNTLTAIWQARVGAKFVIQTSTSSDAGANWSPVVNLSDGTQSASQPQIVAAPNNTLTAIWYWSNGAKFVIQTRTSSDAGANWSPVVNLSDGTQSASQPQIVAAPNNTLTAIWYWSNGAKFVIQTRTSSDAGANWSPVVNLSDGTQSASQPQIVAAPNNTLTAIWYWSNGTKDVIQTRTSNDAGANWSDAVNLSEGSQSATTPQIVAAPNNTLTAIWARSNGTKDVIQTRTSNDAGANWSDAVNLSEGSQSATTPQIVAAPNNTLTAIWARSNVIQSSSHAASSGSGSGSSSGSGSGTGTGTDAGVPGIFLTVAGPVGRSASQSPVYYGADRVSVTSTYLLTVTGVSNIAPTITTLAEGTIDADGSFSSMTRLPALTPGVYNVQMVGTHVNGSTLQLTSQVTIGGVGEFTSIGANIPVIK